MMKTYHMQQKMIFNNFYNFISMQCSIWVYLQRKLGAWFKFYSTTNWNLSVKSNYGPVGFHAIQLSFLPYLILFTSAMVLTILSHLPSSYVIHLVFSLSPLSLSTPLTKTGIVKISYTHPFYDLSSVADLSTILMLHMSISFSYVWLLVQGFFLIWVFDYSFLKEFF